MTTIEGAQNAERVRAGLHLPVRPGDYSACACGWLPRTDDHLVAWAGHLADMMTRAEAANHERWYGPEETRTNSRPEPPSTLQRYDGSTTP